jgi:hypothetical protein
MGTERRGVRPGREELFSRRLCPSFLFFGNVVTMMGTNGETEAEGREEGTLTGVEDLGMAQAEAK